ncbi:unnamed protein product [Lactuca virosa]|uniref:Uncharacterized protein n=1 Tax=Lactuca virosa TaxID=75947 RepID=A0AAU9NCU5_9ASTR|nr:unnamed protein product [Lactuca virosa]
MNIQMLIWMMKQWLKMSTWSILREFGDEEAYFTILEWSHALMVAEKHTMEVALKDVLEKLPDSVVVNEWLEKKNELFNDHKRAYNEDVHEVDCDNEVNLNDIGDGNEGNSSPIIILTDHGENEKKDVTYSTPIVDVSSLTMSQFNALSQVNEDMIRMLDETELQIKLILNELHTEDLRCRVFDALLSIYIKKFNVKPSFEDVMLVLFPVNDDEKYYLLIFDVRTPFHYIVDHVKKIGTLDRKYVMIPNLVMRLSILF